MQVSFIVIVLCADASRAKNVSGVVYYYFLYAFEIETSVGGILWYHTSSVKMLFVTVINSWLTLFVFNYLFLVFLSCSSASFVGLDSGGSVEGGGQRECTFIVGMVLIYW